MQHEFYAKCAQSETKEVDRKEGNKRQAILQGERWEGGSLQTCGIARQPGPKIMGYCSKHVWIADMFEGTGIAAATQQCAIQLPLSTKRLQHSFQVLKSVMKHNFFLCVFTMAGTVMA